MSDVAVIANRQSPATIPTSHLLLHLVTTEILASKLFALAWDSGGQVEIPAVVHHSLTTLVIAATLVTIRVVKRDAQQQVHWHGVELTRPQVMLYVGLTVLFCVSLAVVFGILTY